MRQVALAHWDMAERVHEPLIGIDRVVFDTPHWLGINAFALGLIVALSALTFRFIEEPGRRSVADGVDGDKIPITWQVSDLWILDDGVDIVGISSHPAARHCPPSGLDDARLCHCYCRRDPDFYHYAVDLSRTAETTKSLTRKALDRPLERLSRPLAETSA